MATSKKNEMQAIAKLCPLRTPRPCPECGKPSTREAYPFCSERCRAIDLNRWLNGAYILPGKPLNNADEQQ